MAGKGNALVIAFGKKAHGEPDEDEKGGPSDDDADDIGVDDEEVMAAKAFHDAKSDEERAKALKAFIKICGGY